NDTAQDFAKDILMHELFLQQVARYRDKVAIIDVMGEVSYEQLFRQAYQLAMQLQKHELRSEELVSIRLPRGRSQVIASMAILIAGGAYLPLDTGWPVNRCEQVMDQAQSRIVIVQDSSTEDLK